MRHIGHVIMRTGDFLRLIVKVNRTHESKRDDAMVVKYWFSDSTNSWFSRDVTKIQTKKLSLLLSFYFNVVLQHLKNLYTNKLSVQKARVLRFATLVA